MSRFTACLKITTLLCAGLAAFLTQIGPAAAFDRGNTQLFAVLPAGATGPEGIAVDPRNGDVYVATFGFNTSGPVSGNGKIYVYNDNGKLLRTLNVMGSTSHLLGLDFHPTTHALLVIDFGNANVLKVDPQNGGSTVFMTVPTPPASTGLNALTFDAMGNVYVSDSFNGTIWKTGPSGGAATVWVTDPSLTTTGVPPFGANGLAFNNSGSALFVANTGNDTIVKIPVTGGTAGTPAVFVNSINGADGLIIDDHDNFWVAANQSDEIVVLDKTGKVIAKLGDFDGLDNKGVPNGLLFPASPVFSKDGKSLFVTNLALDIRLFGLVQSVDSQWTAQVQRYTVSRLKADIPKLGGGN